MEQREPTREELFEKIRTLEERLCEAEQTIQAIRGGEVDALVIHKPDGEQLYTLNRGRPRVSRPCGVHYRGCAYTLIR